MEVRSIYKGDSIEREIIQYFPLSIKNILMKIKWGKIPPAEEVRLRAEKPLMVMAGGRDWMITPEGGLTDIPAAAHHVSADDIVKMVELISENSIYSFQEEIRNGFITIRGGHRIGIVGKTVLDQKNVKNIKNFSGINVRIARQIPGAADKVLDFIIKGRNEVFNTLIISPPQCGKTTMLRDVVRRISDGIPSRSFPGQRVGIVDERSEIAACYRGVPQVDVGIRTDVLDGCYKSLGMIMLVRSMSPRVVATDEIGNREDMDAVGQVLHAGVNVIATIHGESLEDIRQRYDISELMNRKAFERYIVLSSTQGPGTLSGVWDGNTMEPIWRGKV